MLVIVSLTVVVISVFTAIYRTHVKETTKNEHYKLGFHRIRVAANNSTNEGFQDEVRTSLIEGAFITQNDSIFKKNDKIESPLPGHPTSDIATSIVNKLLERVDVVFQTKTKV